MLLIECLIICIGFQNCARQMYMTQSLMLSIIRIQVTDEQIRKAFLAKPQLTKPTRCHLQCKLSQLSIT